MNNEYNKTPLNELVIEMTKLEQEINLKLLTYESMRTEVCKRFPQLEEESIFKPKILVIKREKK